MTRINPVTDLTVDGHVAVLTIDSPPVNALSAAVRDGLSQGLAQAIANPAAKAIVLIGAGRTFSAGADISEFGKPPKGIDLLQLEAQIESCPMPVVAAIHGTALGGALELALTCHYRIAVPSARCGLPEIKLGILPGAGGTQRLPRIVGAEKALELVLSGEHVPARTALDMGLLDALLDERAVREGAIAFARKAIAENRPLKKVRDLDDKLEAARADRGLFDRVRKANAKKFRGLEAPERIIQCIEAAVTLPFNEGMKVERAKFLELLNGAQSAAQRYVFFAERQVRKIPDVPEDTPTIPVQMVGVIGAGTMGGGIAMSFASAGIPAKIVEVKQEALDRGLSVIRRNYETTAKKGRLTTDEVERRIALIQGCIALEAVSECDLVIEAVFENMDIKKDVFRRLDGIAKDGAILATNTSYLDVNDIAAVTRRPENVLGLHFFSPANVMRLLEVVRGDKTSNPVIATAMQVARKIGKIGVLVGVCHGFVGNRMLAQRQREATKLILEGSMPWDVDRVLYDFGFPMGPFAMSDLAGLDIGWSRETSKGATVREILCEMDRRGQKTGAGIYDYDEDRMPRPSPVVEGIILDLAARKGIQRRDISDDEILQRCIDPMINEGAKILEEGKALRASDIDIIWINGYGWPVYRGGPMFYADTIGPGAVLSRMKDFEAKLWPEFKPAALLERLAATGGRFQDL